MAAVAPAYVDENDLGYGRIRWAPEPGRSLRLDEAYRMAQLPLVAPGHPDAIRRSADGAYRDGGYEETRYSLVLPVPFASLQASAGFAGLDAAMRGSGFADKIAWDVMSRRSGLLHATICGGLSKSAARAAAERLGPLMKEGPLPFRVGGPLVGQKNLGRIYFPVFPGVRRGENGFGRFQDAMGQPRTDIFLIGYYNLSDHLDRQETAELAALLGQWADATLLEDVADELWVIATNDDLVLSGTVRERISAVAGKGIVG